MLERIAQLMANPNPQMQSGLDMIAGTTPRELLARAQIQGIQSENAEKNRKAEERAYISEILSQGELTPEVVRQVMRYDPEYGLQLMESLRKASQPNNQYMIDPNGRVIAVDKNTGTASYAPFGGQATQPYSEPTQTPSAEGMPPLMGGELPPQNIERPTRQTLEPPPAGLSPKGVGKWEETQIEANAEKKAGAGKAEIKAEEGIDKNISLNSTIDEVIKQTEESNFATGGIGNLMKDVPGTKAHDIMNNVDTIKANIGFDKLQQMRDNSPTGGALGQVSENENKLLQKSIASLEQSQSKEQFIKNLFRLKAQYSKSTERIKKAYMKDYGTLEGFDFGDSGISDAAPMQTQDFGGFEVMGVE